MAIFSTSSRPRFDWAGLAWLYLFFWYFSGVTQALLISTAGSKGFGLALLSSTLWLAPVLVFPRATKWLCALIGLVLWAASLISLGYWGIYGQEFSQSVIFTIFETNPEEAREFLEQYASPRLLLGLAGYSLIALLIGWRLRPVVMPRPKAFAAALVILLMNFSYPYLRNTNFSTWRIDIDSANDKLLTRLEPAAPWQLVAGYLFYSKNLEKVNALLQDNAALPPLKDLTDANGDTPRTLVLVIGEATTSRRMGVYGYPRDTTPRFSALEKAGELAVFREVITSRPMTIEILSQALSFADQKNPDRFLSEPNLINLMRQAGYKTFWITNQQTISARNRILTMFSRQSDEAVYLNQQRAQSSRQYDENVFQPFARVLHDPAPKKFIVVHLLGTHSNYARRYPEAYKKFVDGKNAPKELTASQLDKFNSYDNAVLYNDFVISTLIDNFSASGQSGFLLYFSDHGEEVFNEPTHSIIGRNEGAPTFDMYAIPFVLWMTPEWRKTHPHDFSAFLDRKYSNEHFIHTWSDLAGLHYDRFLPENSLVNPAFKQTTRWIGNPAIPKDLRDFDKLFPDGAK